jgi:hypothetical protein
MDHRIRALERAASQGDTQARTMLYNAYARSLSLPETIAKFQEDPSEESATLVYRVAGSPQDSLDYVVSVMDYTDERTTYQIMMLSEELFEDLWRSVGGRSIIGDFYQDIIAPQMDALLETLRVEAIANYIPDAEQAEALASVLDPYDQDIVRSYEIAPHVFEERFQNSYDYRDQPTAYTNWYGRLRFASLRVAWSQITLILETDPFTEAGYRVLGVIHDSGDTVWSEAMPNVFGQEAQYYSVLEEAEHPSEYMTWPWEPLHPERPTTCVCGARGVHSKSILYQCGTYNHSLKTFQDEGHSCQNFMCSACETGCNDCATSYCEPCLGNHYDAGGGGCPHANPESY